MKNQDPVYIVAAKRTPIGSFMGSLSSVPAPRLGAKVIEALLSTASVSKEKIGKVYMGCVLPAGVGQAPARQAALYAGLPHHVPCTTINKVCGSGMKAVMLAAESLLLESAHVAVGGGMENMSLVPHYLENSRNGYRMGNQKMIDGMIKDGLWDPYNDYHMGNAAELCVKENSFTREEQDAFAIQSFKRAQEAISRGDFKNEIVPITIASKKGEVVVDTDEGPAKAQFDKMGKLSPAFDKSGTITAANASTINDGAAGLLLASEKAVRDLGLKPLAKIVKWTEFAQAPEWFTTAPIEATKQVLDLSGWKSSEVDLFEVNEAFAAVAMASSKALSLSSDKLNVNGGAVSLGHPIGASGARILVTLLHALQKRNLKRGLASICIGGGEATAVTMERV